MDRLTQNSDRKQRARGTNTLKSAEGIPSQDTKRKRAREAHQLDTRKVRSGRPKKASERVTLTS